MSASDTRHEQRYGAMMQWLSAEKINSLAADPARRMSVPQTIDIESHYAFVPEHYTQLYYTPIYNSLHYEHRLRYNQLFGLRINEYIMMLEADLIERLLIPLKKHKRVQADNALVLAVDNMIAEERHHYDCFVALNKACRPDLYPHNVDRLFSVVPFWGNLMFGIAGLLANRLAFSLWYLMALEESSMSMARDMSRNMETETLGKLDPTFTLVHVEHMKDEARHVHIDGLLIDLCIGADAPWRRKLNAKLFATMLPGITFPTRQGAGVKVVRQLVKEMPELQDREAEMIRAILDLKHNRAYQQSLFNRQIMPMTFQLFDRTVELANLDRWMQGYDRK
jgi:hypothetical protein